ncbi:hypothetical protein CJF30_00002274 [Rutstroemia sp. NJR-2017a BBW]|nr:hypothetical protein CJF30_00002274 [Rutstroemia sp. NJR-2017a BBW]
MFGSICRFRSACDCKICQLLLGNRLYR